MTLAASILDPDQTGSMQPRDFIDVLENPQLPRCGQPGERAEILRTLLVHLFFIDLDLDKREFVMLERVLPEGSVRQQVQSLAARKLDLDRLAALFPDQAERKDIMTLAEHAIWGDLKVERREWTLVRRLASVLGLE